MTKQKYVTFKDVESMLYNYNRAKAEINDIELDLLELEHDFAGMSSCGDNDIRPTTPTYAINSTVETEVLSRDKERDRLLSLKAMKEIQVRRVENMLTTLKPDEQELVRLKYFEKEVGKVITRKLMLSDEAIRKNRALIIKSLVNFLNKK